MAVDSGSSSVWARVCAWCGISLPGEDVMPEPAGASVLVTHGICPECRDKFIRAAVAETAGARPNGSSPGGAS